MRRTLWRLAGMPRISPRLYALIEYPKASRKGGRAFQGAIGNATQRLRAAAKAGLAHVAFEQGEETYEISARGRAALAGRHS